MPEVQQQQEQDIEANPNPELSNLQAPISPVKKIAVEGNTAALDEDLK